MEPAIIRTQHLPLILAYYPDKLMGLRVVSKKFNEVIMKLKSERQLAK